MRFKADLVLFAVAVIWGTAFTAQGIAAQNQLAYLFNGASFIFGGLILLPFIRSGPGLPAGQLRWMIVAGGVLFLASALQQVGFYYTKVANVGFVTSLYTVFIPLILWVFFRERPHWIDLAAILFACVGAYLLSTAGSLQIQPGDAIVLAGAFFWAMHFVILGKFATRYDPVSFSSGQFLVGGGLNFLAGLLIEQPARLLLPAVVGAVLYRGLFSIGIGYTLQVWGQRHTSPTDTALILSLEGVFAAVTAWFILGQSLLPLQIFGCLIIFAAVAGSQLKSLTPVQAVKTGGELK